MEVCIAKEKSLKQLIKQLNSMIQEHESHGLQILKMSEDPDKTCHIIIQYKLNFRIFYP